MYFLLIKKTLSLYFDSYCVFFVSKNINIIKICGFIFKNTVSKNINKKRLLTIYYFVILQFHDVSRATQNVYRINFMRVISVFFVAGRISYK